MKKYLSYIDLKIRWQKEIAIFISGSIILLFLYLFKKNNLPPEVPLIFLSLNEIDSLVPLQYLFLLPIIGLVLVQFNNVITRYIQDRFIENTIAWLNLLIIVMSFFAVIKIILLVS